MTTLLKMDKLHLPDSYHYISIYPTLRCNLRCSYCVSKSCGTNLELIGAGERSGEEWVAMLNRIESPRGVPVSFVGGECSLHKDFVYMLKNLKPELGIDLFTNLCWSEKTFREFIREIPPGRIDNHADFPSIRASYHPEQMGDGKRLLQNVLRLKDHGFDIGVEAVMYPSPAQLDAVSLMSSKCNKMDISFRVKSFLGVYEREDAEGNKINELYGNYTKYPGSVFQERTKNCMCKTSTLIIAPNFDVFKCQRDLALRVSPIGNVGDPGFQISDEFRPCSQYGKCHPCDVRVTTNSQWEFGYTCVDIKDVKE